MHRHNKPYRPVASWVRTARATHAISIHYTSSMPDESHRTPMTSPTSQAPVPSAPARTTSRFRKPSVALSWIRGIVFFLDIPPVLFRGWCAFVGSENNAPDNPPDCAPISPCPATPIQRHREITIASCSLGLWILCVVLPFPALAACLERDKTPLARACTIAPCVAVFLAIWFALPHLLTFWTEDYEPSAYYIRFALISTFWPAYIITQARC